MRPGATQDLFDSPLCARRGVEAIGPDACILRAYAVPAKRLVRAVEAIAAHAPLRCMTTPGGRAMSVAMTSCGAVGWVSDAGGYRYTPVDPESRAPWPSMPRAFLELARGAAAAAGFADFAPDSCLVNRYVPGTRLSLHQDKDELDFAAPIVSVSLGLPAVFLFGGARRCDRPRRHRLEHGDVVVWGGRSRRFFHGIACVEEGTHAEVGARRINLTFRKAL